MKTSTENFKVFKRFYFLGSSLLKVSQAEFKVGAAERDLINSCANNALFPIRRFLEGDMKTIQVFFCVFPSFTYSFSSNFQVKYSK